MYCFCLDSELQDLVRGRIFLCSLMAHRGLPVFNDIAKAARACCQATDAPGVIY